MSMFKNKFEIKQAVWIDMMAPDRALTTETQSRCKKQGAIPAVVTGISIIGDPASISYRVCYQTHGGAVVDSDWLPEYVLKHREIE